MLVKSHCEAMTKSLRRISKKYKKCIDTFIKPDVGDPKVVNMLNLMGQKWIARQMMYANKCYQHFTKLIVERKEQQANGLNTTELTDVILSNIASKIILLGNTIVDLHKFFNGLYLIRTITNDVLQYYCSSETDSQ